ncbi:bacteriohemerythrin [Halodesulfovibrio marinisediminis]|uniref:Hemerythrin n=1 Tax=Halodesulfovibrio marinisediminis DSM 17456 TaxID=1121457 RepID=A0A1N6ITQ1_9BACT|nr:bacteriohemerythrin [Halodesulfovibrio marinisediminis]SIO35376.1 hemerythrin [Halodesulfovibrio marinisediminis DSM 17456]
MTLQNRLTASVAFLFGTVVLMFLTDFSLSGAENEFMRHTIQCTLMLTAFLVMVLTIINVRTQLISPLNNIHKFAQKIHKGNFDAQLEGSFNFEFKEVKDSLLGIIANFKEQISQAQKSNELIKITEEQSQRALNAAKEQDEKVQNMLASMQDVASRAHTLSTKAFGAVHELSSQIEQVNAGVDVQHMRMTETATAMEEMNCTVIEVAQNASSAATSASDSKENAETGADGVRRAVESIMQMEKRIFNLKETMGQLGMQADAISQIMVTISDIADQTNLLALNAAIEAARAGEAGRGFAVVADEVRKLAEKTMQATQEVGGAIELIQSHAQQNVQAVELAANDIALSTEAATESGKFMEEIVTIVDETAIQVSSIATASEEQSAASEEINRAISDVTRVASETATGMNSAANAVVELSGLVEELDSMISSLAKGNIENAAAIDGPLLIWNNDLSVGINSIDDQHKVLVSLINELHAAMKARRSHNELLDVIDNLKNYTVTHFGYEEDLFAKHGYPDTKEHVEQHRKFVSEVVDFENGVRSGKLTVTMDVMKFLKNWLTHHIKGTDKQYSGFLSSKGVN